MSSSPTRAPRPTSARSSSPAATARPTAAPSATTCSPRTARSTAARSRRSPPPASRRSRRRSSPCRAGSARCSFADVDALAAAMDERVCAVMLEPVQGEGGVQPSPPGYLEAVRALCDEREALLIMDEVQTGLGRTGEWFGFQHSDDRSPTSSRWRRRSATACRSARAGRAPTSRPRSAPATTPRRSAASRSRRAPRWRRSA